MLVVVVAIIFSVREQLLGVLEQDRLSDSVGNELEEEKLEGDWLGSYLPVTKRKEGSGSGRSEDDRFNTETWQNLMVREKREDKVTWSPLVWMIEECPRLENGKRSSFVD